MTAKFRTLRLCGRAPDAGLVPLYTTLFGSEGPDHLARDLQDLERHALCPWALSHAGRDVGIGGFRIGFAGEGLELSFHFIPEVWGQGLASEFVAAALDHAQAVLKEDRFFGAVPTRDSASARILEKAGFSVCDDDSSDGFLMVRGPLRPPRVADARPRQSG